MDHIPGQQDIVPSSTDVEVPGCGGLHWRERKESVPKGLDDCVGGSGPAWPMCGQTWVPGQALPPRSERPWRDPSPLWASDLHLLNCEDPMCMRMKMCRLLGAQNISSMQRAASYTPSGASSCPHCPRGGVCGLLPSRGRCDSCYSLSCPHFPISVSSVILHFSVPSRHVSSSRTFLDPSPRQNPLLLFLPHHSPLYDPYSPGGYRCFHICPLK